MENLSTLNFFADFPGKRKEHGRRKGADKRGNEAGREEITADKGQKGGRGQSADKGAEQKTKRQRAVYSAERKDSCLSGSTSRVL